MEVTRYLTTKSKLFLIDKISVMFEAINKSYNQLFQFDKLSLGVFLPIESYIGSIPSMTNQIELAQRAENYGFASLWFRDIPLHDPSFGDVGQMYDPWVYLGYIAAQTRNIALVTGSIILPLRHPIHVAKAAASVDQLSQGRVVLGVASGDRAREYPAFDRDISHKAELFRTSYEYTTKLNNYFPLIHSEVGAMSGDLDLIPKATGTRIPMLVTGHSGQSLEWIAKHSDGWIYYPRGIQAQKEIVDHWRATLNKVGAREKPFAQSFYLDLTEDPNTKPVPIHLGYRVGRNWLIEILHALRFAGVNHIAFNLKYGRRPAIETLDELGSFVIPQFNGHLTTENKEIGIT